MRYLVKLVSINIAVFVVALMITNGLCGWYLNRIGEEKRHLLPNYEGNRDHAKAIFDDYHSVDHRYRPFTGWQMQPYRGETLTVNDDGMRTNMSTLNKSGRKSKVVRFFGGSTVWGEGADDAHTIPALFSEAQPACVVTNHAQLAYNSRQNLDALISLYGQGKQADVVIFYDGVNDAAFLCPEEISELPGHRLTPLFQRKIFGGKREIIVTILNNVFTENIIILANHLRNTSEDRQSHYNCADAEKGKTVAAMMMRNWEMAHDLVTARGGRFIAILQPVAFIGSPRTDHLNLDPELGKNFREVYGHIHTLMAEKQYPWITDLTNAFDGDEYIYIDFCHVSANGNAIIAQKIVGVIGNHKEREAIGTEREVVIEPLLSN